MKKKKKIVDLSSYDGRIDADESLGEPAEPQAQPKTEPSRTKPKKQARPAKKAKKRKKPKKRTIASRINRFLIGLVFYLVAILLVPSAALMIAYYHFTQDLPPIDSLQNYRPKTVTYVYSDDGRVIGEYYREHRLVVPLSKIPRHVVLAFVAAEDANYFNHPGLDFMGIARAFIKNVKAGRIVQGGSTITQQVTRSFLLSNEKTYQRKIREALLAYRIEKHLSKEEILFLYLNQIYLGKGAYGIESASQIYFGKHVNEISLAEAALIAGLVRAPGRYSPHLNPDHAEERKIYVLNRMLESQFITLGEAATALQEELKFYHRPNVTAMITPQFTEHIRRTVQALVGPERLYTDGLRIYTTVNIEWQHAARAAVERGLAEVTKRHGYSEPKRNMPEEDWPKFHARMQEYLDRNPAMEGMKIKALITKINVRGKSIEVKVGDEVGQVQYRDLAWAVRWRPITNIFRVGDVVKVEMVSKDLETNQWDFKLVPEPEVQSAFLCMENETGAVKAMIGGRDFQESQFNRAIQARRQPGSSFKPFVYTAAIDMGYTQASNINDIPVNYQDGDRIWTPKNYNRKYSGPTTLYSALTRSVNVVAVRLLERIGAENVIKYARKMGITSPLGPNLSLALGTSEVSPLEMVSAFTTFPNLGERVLPMFITRIEDRDGQVLYRFRPRHERAVSPQTAYIVLDMLRGVVSHGTGTRVRALGRPVAGKTGTSQDLSDAWFVGFTPGYTGAAWVGYDQRKSLGYGEAGGSTAAPIFLYFFQEALKDKPVRKFKAPSGIIRAGISSDEEGFDESAYGRSYCFVKGNVGPGDMSEGPDYEGDQERFAGPVEDSQLSKILELMKEN